MTKAEELITAQDIESVIDIDNADSNFDLKKAIPYLIILIACCLFDTITNLLPVVPWGIYTPVIISGVAIIGYAFSFYKLKPYSKFFGILMFISAINVIFEEINMEWYGNLYIKIPLYISVQASAIAEYRLISLAFVKMFKIQNPGFAKRWSSFWFYSLIFYIISVGFVAGFGWMRPSHYIDYSWIIPPIILNVLLIVLLAFSIWACRKNKSME